MVELERLAQQEIKLVEQIAYAQYPIDLSRYRLKSVKVPTNSEKGSHTLHEVNNKSGLLLHALIDTDGDGIPQYSFRVDGTHLFPDMNTLSPHVGVSPALLRNYGYKSLIHPLMPTLLVDDGATPQYVIDYTPQPPVPFHSSLKVEYHDQAGTASNITLFLWWLEEPEAGLSSQVR